jgi:hypothetical protein
MPTGRQCCEALECLRHGELIKRNFVTARRDDQSAKHIEPTLGGPDRDTIAMKERQP